MSDRAGLEIPHAALELQATTLFARVSAGEDVLQIDAPFGTLLLPYARIVLATRDTFGGVRLDLEGGAKVSLHPNRVRHQSNLVAVIREKGVKTRT